MTKWLVLLFLLLLPVGAGAQQQKPDPVMQGLTLALQQVGTSTVLYIEEMQRRLAEKDARITELQRLCGEPCKPLAEAK